MLAKGMRDGQAGIVTSGTGSGKTESFLLPVLATILDEAKRAEGDGAPPAPDYLKHRWWCDPQGKPFAERDREGIYGLERESRFEDWSGTASTNAISGQAKPVRLPSGRWFSIR